jgi:2,4-dienoyl-CoA reductase-like NADH-dependent reductase (Old Yellow Enzyme family)
LSAHFEDSKAFFQLHHAGFHTRTSIDEYLKLKTPEDLSALLKTEMPLMAWNASLYSAWGKKQREDACNYQG